MNTRIFLLFIVVLSVLLYFLMSKNTNVIMETFNPVLFVKNQADTFPLSPDFNIDKEIQPNNQFAPYLGWKKIWRLDYN